MTQQEYLIHKNFQDIHQGPNGALVLADELYELGFVKKHTSQDQVTLANYAIHVIEKMGVVTNGQKYQLCLRIAEYLQTVIPEGDMIENEE